LEAWIVFADARGLFLCGAKLRRAAHPDLPGGKAISTQPTLIDET